VELIIKISDGGTVKVFVKEAVYDQDLPTTYREEQIGRIQNLLLNFSTESSGQLTVLQTWQTDLLKRVSKAFPWLSVLMKSSCEGTPKTL
jgi:hypothetical protein